MTVTVINNNGTQTRYLFDPAGFRAIGDFYQRLMNEGKIKNFSIVLDN